MTPPSAPVRIAVRDEPILVRPDALLEFPTCRTICPQPHRLVLSRLRHQAYWLYELSRGCFTMAPLVCPGSIIQLQIPAGTFVTLPLANVLAYTRPGRWSRHWNFSATAWLLGHIKQTRLHGPCRVWLQARGVAARHTLRRETRYYRPANLLAWSSGLQLRVGTRNTPGGALLGVGPVRLVRVSGRGQVVTAAGARSVLYQARVGLFDVLTTLLGLPVR